MDKNETENEILFEDVMARVHRKNKILFTRESECLKSLLEQIRKESHQTLILWSFANIEEIIIELRLQGKYDQKIEVALNLCKRWASGHEKMKEAKKALLEVHALAKETEDPVGIALFHAIGQGLSTVHVETHAIGLVLYELSSIVKNMGLKTSLVLLWKRLRGIYFLYKNGVKLIKHYMNGQIF